LVVIEKDTIVDDYHGTKVCFWQVNENVILTRQWICQWLCNASILFCSMEFAPVDLCQ